MPTWRIHIFVFVLALMVVSFVYLRVTGAKITPEPSVSAPLERTIVHDAKLLERVNPGFYQGVAEGDVVLRYADRLDLYRPSEGRVIRSVKTSR